MAIDPELTMYRDTTHLIENLGVYGAREYAARMPKNQRWDAVRDLLENCCNSRQTREANVKHIRAIERGTNRT